MLAYVYLKVVLNTCKNKAQNKQRKMLKLNYLNPYFFIELIEIHIIDNKFLKILNLL